MKNPLLKSHAIGDPKRTYGEITDPNTKEIASRFKDYQRKTAENIIEMSRIVIEAKQRPDFSDFCILIGQSEFSSTIRKLEVIGKKYQFLISRAHKLPPNWTTIYKVCQLGEELIEDNINKGYISPQVTGGLVDKLVNKLTPNLTSKNSQKVYVPNGTPSDYSFKVVFCNKPNQHTINELETFISDLGYLGGNVAVSTKLEELLDPVLANI